jgi:hypothetical protein
MKEEALVDYAAPLMHVEHGAKAVHIACLARQYDVAEEAMLLVIADARLTLQAIRHMKEKEKAHEATIAAKKDSRRD